MSDVRGISKEALQKLEKDGAGLGIRNPFPAQPRHRHVVEMLNEVAEKMGVNPPPPLAMHDGSVLGTAYHAASGLLAISEKSVAILTPQELKAQMAHELDHHLRAPLLVRLTNANDKMMQRKSSGLSQEAIIKFTDFLEFNADDRAVKLYGKEAMVNSLKKLLVEGAIENEGMKLLFFPDRAPEQVAAIERQELEQRVDDLAEGRFPYPQWSLEQLKRRFNRLQEQSQAI